MINSEVMELLYILAGILIFLLITLICVYYLVKRSENKQVESKNKTDIQQNEKKVTEKSGTKTFTVGSVFDFMEFDKIIDSMISQKKGKKYSMVIECQGINYDLMSENEKIAVEEGFIQFLNTLQDKVQIYVQTRTINLEESIRNYKERLVNIEKEFNKQKMKYKQAVQMNAREEDIKREYFEMLKKQNLYEYTLDIIHNTEKMNLNKYMLNKKYYIIISYYTIEDEGQNLDKEELREKAFSELYTKCQSAIRTLSMSGVQGKILTSVELVDLLYVAYNRDDAEIYGVDKAVQARYDEMYSTAPDYMEKKLKLLDEEIEHKAEIKANEKILQARSDLQRQYEERKEKLDEIIAEMAQSIVSSNEFALGKEVTELANEKIEEEIKSKETRKEKNSNVQKKAN